MGGIVGVTKLGNTKLVTSGITTEKSDLRMHVSVATKRVYVYSTASGLSTIKTGRYTALPVKTGNIVTAMGYPVPCGDIPGCASYAIPEDLFRQANFVFTDSTSAKGNKAVLVVKEMLRAKLIPIVLDINEIEDKVMQISGVDIVVKTTSRIQVKCDWRAGHKEYGGTGNLFLQVEECNPYSLH